MIARAVLLSSTAVTAAAAFLADPACAQIELFLAGYTEFGVVGTEREELIDFDIDGRRFAFFMDNVVFIEAEGADDATGITHGARIALKVGANELPDDEPFTFVDEVVLFLSGAFGRIELGQQTGVADVMMLGGESVAAGTGGTDGDLPIELAAGNIITADGVKAMYFTPRVGGFLAGVSYTPDESGFENFIELGANFVGNVAGLDVGVAGVVSLPDGLDDLDGGASWAVGGTLGVPRFYVGASYGNDEAGFLEREFFTAGVGLDVGLVNVSFTWERDAFDGAPVGDASLFVASADLGLIPGTVLKADLGYNTAVFDAEDAAGDADDAWAAVVTVQLNY